MLETVIFIFAMLLYFSVIVICFVCGFQFRKRKWLILIAGYNEFDKQTRDKMDKQRIGRESGTISLLTGVFLTMVGLIIWLSSYIPFFTKTENALALILIPTAFFIYYVLKKVKVAEDYYKKFR